MSRGRLTALFIGLLLTATLCYYLTPRHLSGDFDDLTAAVNGHGGASSPWSKHGKPPTDAPNSPPYGAVVVASRQEDDLTWTKMPSFEKNWNVYAYDVDNPRNPNETRLRIPANKGHEAMVYLTFIVDNYDHLAWMTVFTHGHFLSWHQAAPLPTLINTLNRSALAARGYVSLRCDWYPSCPAEIRPLHRDTTVWGPGLYREQAEGAIAGNWKQLFPGERLPATLASPCCAQFAVTRTAVQRRPRADYWRMREWLLDSLATDEVSGRVLEKLWAYIFTGEAVQ